MIPAMHRSPYMILITPLIVASNEIRHFDLFDIQVLYLPLEYFFFKLITSIFNY